LGEFFLRHLRIAISLSLLLLVFVLYIPIVQASEVSSSSIQENIQVSPGVQYKNIRLDNNQTKQAIRVLEIDLHNPFAKLEPGIPKPLTNLLPTSSHAKLNSGENHHVVGAINGSFYHFSSKLPAYLIAENNRIFNLGVISTGFDEYMSVPTAFGVTKDGQALIDTYQYEASIEVNGKTINVSSINKARQANEIILYTPEWSYESTRTNEYGLEIVVQNIGKSIDHDLNFGEVVVGTVSQVSPYGKGNSLIPKDGYVISVQGGHQAAQFADVKPGQNISLKIDINGKWKQAQFILASGPMLVKNGQVYLTIDEKSPRAKERHPRTAVAVDASKKKVFFVTVDGRQPGYSNGMSLKEFAQYLVSLGADSALNLDGGGSTTMVVRRYGNQYSTVANSPSEGKERAVSTILQAVSTAPYGQPTYMLISKKHNGDIPNGSSVELEAKYVLDQYYNPLPFQQNQISYTVEGNIGRIEGNRFIATGVGTGFIVGKYGNASAKIPITVVENRTSPLLLDGFHSLSNWQAENARSAASIRLSSTSEPVYEGSTSLKLSYDFTVGEKGIKAAYITAKQPIKIQAYPKRIGVWVFGDAKKHWLRGKIIDAKGDVYTINFTEEGGLDWNGWKYVKAEIPSQVSYPVSFKQLYIAEAYQERQGKGELYFDKLQAEYSDMYEEPLFKDVPNHFWAKTEIQYLVENNIINGYTDGTFKPNMNLKRVHAAVLLARQLKLPTNGVPNPNFKDIPKNHPYYDVIASVAHYGIITGKQNGTVFDPDGTLTRAQMAVILQRAYQLKGNIIKDFADVPKDYWAYDAISAIAANNITTGYQEDHTFRPENPVTRAQFSAFLYRILTKDGGDE
jgi:hypothetical protein